MKKSLQPLDGDQTVQNKTLMETRNPRLVIDLPVVLLKVTELSKALLAVWAGVRFHSGVDADMLGQVARVCKWLGTMRTLVRLGLCVVPDEETGGGERQKTGCNVILKNPHTRYCVWHILQSDCFDLSELVGKPSQRQTGAKTSLVKFTKTQKYFYHVKLFH